jgi:hypothetical protein
VVRLRVPRPVITAKCAPYLKHGKPERRAELMNLPDSLIISTFGAEYRGIVQYYLLASDVFRLARLRWAAETSLLKTLALTGLQCVFRLSTGAVRSRSQPAATSSLTAV